MRRFKSIKVKKKRKVTKYVFIFFFFFSYVFMYRYLSNKKINKNVLNKDINYIKFNLKNTLSNKIKDIVNKPVYFLNENVRNTKNIEVNKANVVKKALINENKVENKKPLIYIYNTHEKEEYVNYTIYDASYNISNKLNDNGINTIFEERSVGVFLQKENLKYYKSYDISKEFIKEILIKYPSIKYFIDFHRDSISKDKTTVTYNEKKYAKILFLVGLDNPSYTDNLNNTNKFNEIIKSKVPNISRGIMQKKGKGVNGIYNQDISSNLFLIEVGGKDNTKEEVDNTMDVIYNALIQYIGEVV